MVMNIAPITLWCVLCLGGKNSHGMPRGGGEDPSKQRHRDLRGRLSGGRGGAGGNINPKWFDKRDPILLGPRAMPKPLSDHTATLYEGKVFIAGGCDSPTGNEFDPDFGFYFCSSISESMYAFDPIVDFGRGRYSDLTPLPRPRYRHTSVALNDQIWLLGGRDTNDNLMDSIDIYDIATDTWSALTMPQLLQTSDHASFVNEHFIYIVGGYDAAYTAKDEVWRINTQTAIIEDVRPLTFARGDIAATYTSEHAYVVGGYDKETCQTFGVVEQYEFSTDLWTTLPSLTQGRFDAGAVTIGGLVMVLGGERLIDRLCTSNDSDLASYLQAVGSVEILGAEAWFELTSPLELRRSRFATVALDSTDTIYTFGGQSEYNPSCQCYSTTDDVLAYRKLYDEAVDLIATPSPVADPTTAPVTIANDFCEDATPLDVQAIGLGTLSPAFGTTVGASIDSNAPSCAGISADQPGVWFNVLGEKGIMTARTCGSFTDYDTLLSVYRGSCHDLECMGADNDSCSTQNRSQVSWVAQSGVTYHILVHGVSTNPVGNYQISVQSREPSNDECTNAQGPLLVGDVIPGSTNFATLDFDGSGNLQTCGDTSYGPVEGVWYYTTGTGNVIVADTCNSRTGYNAQIHVFSGECQNLDCVEGNGSSLECGTFGSGLRGLVRWESEIGMKYYIYVHGFEDSIPSSGFFMVSLSEE